MAQTHRELDPQRHRGQDAAASRARHAHKIRYNSTEWAIVVERACRCGRAPARYVRETSLGAVPKADRTQPLNAVIHELGRAATALTQLAALGRQTGTLPNALDLERTVHQMLAAVQLFDGAVARRRTP